MLRFNSNNWAFEGLAHVNLRQGTVVAELKLPVELLDTLVATFSDLMDRSAAHVRTVLEDEPQRHRSTTALLEDCYMDLAGRLIVGDFD